MENLSLLLALLLGLVLGALLGAWLVWRRLSGGTGEAAHVRRELDALRTEHQSAREELAAVRAENRAVTAQRSEDAERAQAESRVLSTLAPLGQQLASLQKQVSVLERDRVEQFGQLGEQLRVAAATDRDLLNQTTSLMATLKSTSARGHWGEAQLRRVVEAAGMLHHVDFSEQTTIVGTEGERLRPDLVVSLPGGKSLAVDAKAPLGDALAAEALADEPGEEAAERRRALAAQHAAAVRRHVDQLAAKSYWSGLSHSPELVLCFLPAESLLAAALDADGGLLDHAFSKNVALVAPVSLLTALKSVAYAWRQDRLAENAQFIVTSARELYDRLGTLGSHLDRMGGSLKTTVDRYNQLVGTVESRVLPSARKLREADPGLPPTAGIRTLESAPRVLSAPELVEGLGMEGLSEDDGFGGRRAG
ncbi:DNA recombination protein RmuC [Micrococcus sp. 2A]|uniref:DNA recombination protein RmuC n=1 Tax=unclassified Micrococcus TaxID=2620948 RepID=UPI0029BA4C95|nr:DNA recombination protein RmuC [Micrococcus sp. M4NT]MDX2340324.1 DNA recombination protein RmuC [Micrococcus sp. M4NT]